MANRRMYAIDVLDTDKFMEMSEKAQLLYVFMGMAADDDGFIGKPKAISRLHGCTEQEITELAQNGYLILFPSGICVISHWKVNNYIRSDRYKETVYKEEKAQLAEGEDGVYFLAGNSSAPLVYQRDTQVRVGQDRIGQVRKEREEPKKNAKEQNPLPLGEHKNVFLTKEELIKLKNRFSDYRSMIENLSRKIAMHGYKYQNHYAVLLAWAENDAKKAAQLPAGNPESHAPPNSSHYNYTEIEQKIMQNMHPSVAQKDAP